MLSAFPINVQAASTPKKVTELKVKQKTGKYKSYKEKKKIYYTKYKYMQLSWKKIKGVTGYEIYRYGEASQTWHKVKTVASDKTTYIIPEVEKGMNVQLKVRAYKTNGMETVYGEFSAVKSFTGKKNYWLNGKMKSGKYYKKLGIYEDPAIKKGWYRFISERAFNIQNKYRAEVGESPLEWNEHIYNMSKIRSEELSIKYSHTRPNGEKVATVMKEYFSDNPGLELESMINLRSCAENAAQGQATSKQVMSEWKNSNGHYANIKSAWNTTGAISLYIDKYQRYNWDALFMFPSNLSEILSGTTNIQ